MSFFLFRNFEIILCDLARLLLLVNEIIVYISRRPLYESVQLFGCDVSSTCENEKVHNKSVGLVFLSRSEFVL